MRFAAAGPSPAAECNVESFPIPLGDWRTPATFIEIPGHGQ